jgi:tRNA A37 threonylcarbamoyladenosine dehydratase
MNKPDDTGTVDPRRFSGVSRIYGRQAYNTFEASHICIIGLGGVGSWVVEALTRSAIGKLTLVDMDHVAESNFNRQLQATEDSLGQSKAESLKKRIHSINPLCRVNIIDDFISPENQEAILTRNYDWVIDCIDSYRTKAALIYFCRRNKIKLITIGGAGGMTDPGCLKISDLSKTCQDPLLAKTRKLLRKDYHFPQNPTRRFGIPCVFSSEPLSYPDGNGNISSGKPAGVSAAGLNCAGGFGSAVCVTATAGFFAASYVLRKLARIT